MLFVAAAVVSPSIAMQGDTVADRVLGQDDFVHNAPSSSNASSLDNPYAVAVDQSATPNRLYVSDTLNSRVLGYNDVSTFINGGPADLVIGQPDFMSTACNPDGVTASSLCQPQGLAVDLSGNLYVADNSNSRVLEYSTPFAGCAGTFPCVGGGAHLVFGQGGIFTSNILNEGGLSADSLEYPLGVAVDAGGNVYVADTSNNRVLEYNTPLTTDTTADRVIGQPDFISDACNNGGVSASSLCGPIGVTTDLSGNLYVADQSNNRVLEYNTPLTKDTIADHVFGQGGSFTSNSLFSPDELTANSLNFPAGVALDSSGDLYISDTGNHRVLEFNTPLTNDTADVVFGQGGDFSSALCNAGGLSASSLCHPFAAAVDSSDNLYIADKDNNRVLEYDNPLGLTTSMTATASLAFGNAVVGETIAKSLTIHNTGKTNPLDISGATPSDPEYAVISGGSCGAIPITVAPKKTCTITVAFTPSALGPHSATLTLSDNGATGSQTVSLGGTGTVTMAVSPASREFASVKDGFRSTTSITVHNYQNNPVSLSEGFSGSNPGDFSVTGGNCTSTLSAKSACLLLVTFAPSAVGLESADMTVTGSPDPLGPYTVSFTASETLPESLSPTSVHYGNVAQTASKTMSVAVTNHATGPITLTGASTTTADFKVTTGGSCPLPSGTLAALTSCTYAVTFTPSTETVESDTLSIGVLEDPTSPRTVTLTGNGVTPLRVTPAAISFSTFALGHSSGNRTVTVTNNGSATLTINESINVTTGNSGDFVVSGGTCTTLPSGSLTGSGASCTYTLKFTPSVVELESATLAVTASGDGMGAHDVGLSGTGS
jgi:uncharacterized membrane protein YgdD (TMEM256/DUF423 family)